MPSKIKKDGRIRWMGRVQKLGRIKQKLFDTKAEALDWEAIERKADWEETTDTVCSLKEWAEAYLDYAGKYDPKTYSAKRLAFRKLFAAKTGKAAQPIVNPLAQVTSLTPGKALAALTVQFNSRTGNAANKDRKHLIAAWKWGMKYLGMPGPNPCRVDQFPEERHPRYVPPEEDFWKAYAEAKGQDRIMLLAYLHLAARRSELFRLRWEEDVDFKNGQVRLYTRKRKDGTLEYDWLPMTADLSDALRWWKENRTFTDAEHVFVCEQDGFGQELMGKPFRARIHFMNRLCERARVKAFGLHAIRHLTASTLYRRGEPLGVMQAILRHKSPNTTALYLKSLGLEETRGALEGLAAWFAENGHNPGPGNGFGSGSGSGQDTGSGKVLAFKKRRAVTGSSDAKPRVASGSERH